MKNISEKPTRREFLKSLGLAAIALSLTTDQPLVEELFQLTNDLRSKFITTSKSKQQTALEMLEGFAAETSDKDLSDFFLVVANNFREAAK